MVYTLYNSKHEPENLTSVKQRKRILLKLSFFNGIILCLHPQPDKGFSATQFSNFHNLNCSRPGKLQEKVSRTEAGQMQPRSLAVAVILLFIFALGNPVASVAVQSTNRDEHAQEHDFLARREHFDSGRQLLLQKHVPFDPEELLRDGWAEKLKPALDAMPEMHEIRYERAPLNGAYMVDTLYLPEKVQLSGHTFILANYVVFEGKNPVIKGNFDIYFFPTKPTAVLGTTLAQALHNKPGLLNAKFGHTPMLPSFSLISDLADKKPHVITFDTSGETPKLPEKSRPTLHNAAWHGFELATELQQDCSQGCNKTPPGVAPTGPGGFSPPPAPPGTPNGGPKANDGTCAIGGNPDGGNGQFGGKGPDGAEADQGGQGNIGLDAGNIMATVNDTGFYDFIANGQKGGQGGPGGIGGTGGDGGAGTAGGTGVACSCTAGSGGNGGKGGDAGVGGKGGKGGIGGVGGRGGAITVSLPFNSPGLTWSNSGGVGGMGGEGGPSGSPGNPGVGGAPGIGATACTQKAADGIFFGSGNSASFGPGGAGGDAGPSGQPGPPPNITKRPATTGGGVGVTDPCLGGQGPDGGSNGFTTGVGPTCSPIIVDTLGDGFELTAAQTGVRFDISGSGHPIQIAWTVGGSHDAFLALPGPDGLVHDGKQLFGNFTPQPASNHPNGFLALAQFDKPENGGNGDGIIDERDAVFSRLRLWIDDNHDGVCQANELHTLPELGVFSLALKYRESRRTDDFGNQFRYKAKVNPDPADGESDVGRWTYDVFLTTLKK